MYLSLVGKFPTNFQYYFERAIREIKQHKSNIRYMIHFLIQFGKECETFKRFVIYRHLIRLYPGLHRRCQNKSMERKDGARNPAGSPRTSIRSPLYSSGQREEIVELHTPSESVAVELKNIWTKELVLGVRHGTIVAANVRLNRGFEKIQQRMPLCTSDRSSRRIRRGIIRFAGEKRDLSEEQRTGGGSFYGLWKTNGGQK